VGVPEIEPLLLLNVSPDGRDGEIEKLLTAPPELLTLTVEIALLALTDCVALESEIEGAATAGASVVIVSGDETFVPPAESVATKTTLYVVEGDKPVI
jgi:hypothetical protein